MPVVGRISEAYIRHSPRSQQSGAWRSKTGQWREGRYDGLLGNMANSIPAPEAGRGKWRRYEREGWTMFPFVLHGWGWLDSQAVLAGRMGHSSFCCSIQTSAVGYGSDRRIARPAWCRPSDSITGAQTVPSPRQTNKSFERKNGRALLDHNGLTLSPCHSGESRSPEVFGGRWIPGQARNDRLGALSDSIRTKNTLDHGYVGMRDVGLMQNATACKRPKGRGGG